MLPVLVAHRRPTSGRLLGRQQGAYKPMPARRPQPQDTERTTLDARRTTQDPRRFKRSFAEICKCFSPKMGKNKYFLRFSLPLVPQELMTLFRALQALRGELFSTQTCRLLPYIEGLPAVILWRGRHSSPFVVPLGCDSPLQIAMIGRTTQYALRKTQPPPAMPELLCSLTTEYPAQHPCPISPPCPSRQL